MDFGQNQCDCTYFLFSTNFMTKYQSSGVSTPNPDNNDIQRVQLMYAIYNSVEANYIQIAELNTCDLMNSLKYSILKIEKKRKSLIKIILVDFGTDM